MLGHHRSSITPGANPGTQSVSQVTLGGGRPRTALNEARTAIREPDQGRSGMAG
jgi:hypothetical protein